MSHKRAKAIRKRTVFPSDSLPFSSLSGEYTGKFKNIPAEQLEVFNSVKGHYPIKQQFLTRECKKYWFKKGN